MRIILDQGVHDLRNTGNNAMLQVAVGRIRKLWPNALIEVVTESPHLLKMYCPDVYPTGKDAQYDSPKYRDRLDNMHRFVPKPVWRLLIELREEVWRRWPALHPVNIRRQIRSWIRFDARHSEPEFDISGAETDVEENRSYLMDGVKHADLVVVVGTQLLVDLAKDCAIPVLDRLEAAVQLGRPTAMVGQGVGPIHDPELWARAEAVLPSVGIISVRDKKISPLLLKSMGVDPARVVATGDEAIEMAYEARSTTLGTGIGVSMRVTHYTEVENHHLELVRKVLSQEAEKYAAQLIALPISHGSNEWDAKFIQQLLAGHNNTLTGWQRFDTPLEIIKKVRRCRLVVTGTFHGAVFALGQGIPVVALAKSPSYIDKLSALADQFGCGCEVLILDDKQLPDKLSVAIDKAWQSAEQVRPQLLKAAVHQIESGYRAYQRIFELVSPKDHMPSTTQKSVSEAD